VHESAPGHPPEENSEDNWHITLAPEGKTLGDDRANGKWIVHLLDTARTAQFTEIPFTGSLESFGLTQPRVLLRWSVAVPPAEQTHEPRIGAPARDLDGTGEGFSGQITQSPNESPELGRTVYVVKGAILQMLEMISSFDSLRLRTLATFTADQVDELKISTGPNTLLQARREPGVDGEWKTLPNPKHSSHADASTLGAFVEQLCHLRIEQFIDDPTERAKLAVAISKSPLYQLDFRGPHGLQAALIISGENGRIFATISTRHVPPSGTSGSSEPTPLSVFEIPPDILGAIAVLVR
jgi:hypothetical protein